LIAHLGVSAVRPKHFSLDRDEPRIGRWFIELQFWICVRSLFAIEFFETHIDYAVISSERVQRPIQLEKMSEWALALRSAIVSSLAPLIFAAIP
jgi:hypothetical protein